MWISGSSGKACWKGCSGVAMFGVNVRVSHFNIPRNPPCRSQYFLELAVASGGAGLVAADTRREPGRKAGCYSPLAFCDASCLSVVALAKEDFHHGGGLEMTSLVPCYYRPARSKAALPKAAAAVHSLRTYHWRSDGGAPSAQTPRWKPMACAMPHNVAYGGCEPISGCVQAARMHLKVLAKLEKMIR